MDDLPSDVRQLITSTRRHDGPSTRDKERVSHKLTLALAGAGGAAAVAATKSAVAATTLTAGQASSGAMSSAAAVWLSAPTAVTTGVTNVAAGAVTTAATNAIAVASAAQAGVATTTAAVGSALGGAASKALVAPAAVTATTWGGSVTAWLFGVTLVGAGAVSAPKVVQWVNEEVRTVSTAPVDVSLARHAPVKRANPPTSETPHADQLVANQVLAHERTANESAATEPAANEPAANELSKLAAPGVDAAPVAAPAVAPKLHVGGRAEPNPPPDAAYEVSLLSQAQRALAEGDAVTSLARLQEHAQRFPKSALATERAALRVFAYCHLGRVSDAQAAARAFFPRGSGSPLSPKVEASCINSNAHADRSTNSKSTGD